MEWYKREIRKYSISTTGGMIGVGIDSIIILIWVYFTSDFYKWQNIEIVPLVPWIPILISALTFATIGKLLYKTKLVYPPLYFICVVLLRDKKLYRESKEYIWIFLMFFMWIIALPIFISFINFLISLVVNFFYFLFYLSPPIGFSGLIFLGLTYYLNKKNDINKTRYRKI